MQKTAFSFDDILIQPSYVSRVRSRSQVDTTTLLGYFPLRQPLISASMAVFDYDGTTYGIDTEFGQAMADLRLLHIFSRHTNSRISQRLDIAQNSPFTLGIAVSLDEFRTYRKDLEGLSAIISIDIANGAIISPEDIQNWSGEFPLIVGNYANPFVISKFHGENVIYKMGIGGGSACTTRLKTGVGYPQAGLIAVTDDVRNGSAVRRRMPDQQEIIVQKDRFISDGGIKSTGDYVKAIALGADYVMVGKMLAGAKETPSKPTRLPDGRWVKPYYGMASTAAKGHSKNVEGVSGYVPYEDKSLKEIVLEFDEALRSAMSYTNSLTIEEFQRDAEIIHITHSSQYENSTRLI